MTMVAVVVRRQLTANPNAPEYKLIDPDQSYPWRQKELLRELNKALSARINPYDLLALRRCYGVDSDPKFVYKHQFGSQQYSPAFAEWVLEQHSRDPRIFQQCRLALSRAPSPQSATLPQLQWLATFMQTEGLSQTQVAKKLKIGAGTVSRLLAGKYKGDVERMLERIDAYRRQHEVKAA